MSTPFAEGLDRGSNLSAAETTRRVGPFRCALHDADQIVDHELEQRPTSGGAVEHRGDARHLRTGLDQQGSESTADERIETAIDVALPVGAPGAIQRGKNPRVDMGLPYRRRRPPR